MTNFQPFHCLESSIRNVRDFLMTRHFALNGFCNTTADFDNPTLNGPEKKKKKKNRPLRENESQKNIFHF